MANYDKKGVINAYFKGEGNAQTSNKSLSTSEKGRSLYSYYTPIAYVSPNGKGVYLNKENYSSTTSTGQNLFREEAKNRKITYQEVSEEELREKIERGD